MSTVSTTRPINQAQLMDELAVTALSMSDDGTERTVTCHDETVLQETLQAAVDAHVPNPPPPSAAHLLQAQVDELADLLFTFMEGL